MSDWILVKDRLPEEGQLVLVLLDRRSCHKDKMLSLNGFLVWPQRVCLYDKLSKNTEPRFLDDRHGYSFDPSHWQPLPEFPK